MNKEYSRAMIQVGLKLIQLTIVEGRLRFRRRMKKICDRYWTRMELQADSCPLYVGPIPPDEWAEEELANLLFRSPSNVDPKKLFEEHILAIAKKEGFSTEAIKNTISTMLTTTRRAEK